MACIIAGLMLAAICLMIGRQLPEKNVNSHVIFGLSGFFMLISVIYPFVWQQKETQGKADSLLIIAFWEGVIRYGLAFDIAMFAFKKIFQQQFIIPYSMYDEKIGNLSGEWLTWHYFGFSHTFGIIIALIQLTGAILLVFQRTRLLGVIILLPVILNIFCINVFYGLNAGATLQSIILLIGLLYFIFINYKRLVHFFFQAKDKVQTIEFGGNIFKNLLRFLVIFMPFMLVYQTYRTEIKPKNIRGAYEITHINENLFPKEFILKKIYFENHGECMFKFNNNATQLAHYTFDNNTNQVSIDFNIDRLSDVSVFNNPLIGTIKQLEDNKMMITGHVGKNNIEINLLKIR